MNFYCKTREPWKKFQAMPGFTKLVSIKVTNEKIALLKLRGGVIFLRGVLKKDEGVRNRPNTP